MKVLDEKRERQHERGKRGGVYQRVAGRGQDRSWMGSRGGAGTGRKLADEQGAGEEERGAEGGRGWKEGDHRFPIYLLQVKTAL